MPVQPTRLRGECGERIAEEFLRARGYAILGRNLRAGRRELDLVVARGSTLVAVEVKWRQANSPVGGAWTAWGPRQRARAGEAALLWCRAEYPEGEGRPWRFDLVVIEEEPDGLRLVHRRGAWAPAGAWW